MSKSDSPNIVAVALNLEDPPNLKPLPYKINTVYINEKFNFVFKILEDYEGLYIYMYSKSKGMAEKRLYRRSYSEEDEKYCTRYLNDLLKDARLATEDECKDYQEHLNEYQEQIEADIRKEKANWFLAHHTQAHNLIRDLFARYDNELDRKYLAPLTSVESVKNYMAIKEIKTTIPDFYIVNAILIKLDKQNKNQ